VDGPSPAVHRLAPLVRGHRRDPRAQNRWRTPHRHVDSVLPRSRRRRACARRVARPTAAHRHSGPGARDRCRTFAGWRSGARRGRYRADGSGPAGVHGARAGTRRGVQRRALRRDAALRRRFCRGVGRLPGADRLLRPSGPPRRHRRGRRGRGIGALLGAAIPEHAGPAGSPARRARRRNDDDERRRRAADRRAAIPPTDRARPAGSRPRPSCPRSGRAGPGWRPLPRSARGSRRRSTVARPRRRWANP